MPLINVSNASGNQYTYSASVVNLSSLESFKINLKNLLFEIMWQGNGLFLVGIPEGVQPDLFFQTQSIRAQLKASVTHSTADLCGPKAVVLMLEMLQGVFELIVTNQFYSEFINDRKWEGEKKWHCNQWFWQVNWFLSKGTASNAGLSSHQARIWKDLMTYPLGRQLVHMAASFQEGIE